MDEHKPLPLFTYGSLMENLFNYQKYLHGKVLKRPNRARIKGQLFHLPEKGYPALLPGNDWVYGEVFELRDFAENIKAVDGLENYFGTTAAENEYQRQVIEVALFNETTQAYGECIEAYGYFYVPANDPRFAGSLYLPNGDWRSYHEKLTG